MKDRAYKTYPTDFKRDAANLVVDQSYTLTAACKAMDVGQTAVLRWVRQLRDEQGGKTPTTARALTQEHQQIQALQKEICRLKREKDILKKPQRSGCQRPSTALIDRYLER